MGDVLMVAEIDFKAEARDGQRHAIQLNDDTRFRRWCFQVENTPDLVAGIKGLSWR